MIADELRRQADQFIDLRELEKDICRLTNGRDRRPPPAPQAEPEYYDDEDEDEDEIDTTPGGSHKL
jgi:hypothetical protein